MNFIRFFFFSYLLFTATTNYAQELTDLEGHKISFDSLKGKWVFINYWASWCQPCLNEISELNRFYDLNKKQIALYAVNYDALPIREQKALISKLKLHYPSLSVDPASSLHLEELRGVPATFIFNPQGQLTTTLYGGQTIRSLQKIITN